MKKNVLFIVAVILFSAQAYSTKIAYPGAYASIKLSMEAAVSGDTIDIAAGTYTEQITYTASKTLTIQGAGMNSTIVQAAVDNTSELARDFAVFKMDPLPTSDYTITFKNMTIRHGYNTKGGGGIRLIQESTAATVTLKFNGVKISDNRCGTGGGAMTIGGKGKTIVDIQNCIISNNTVTGTGNGGGINIGLPSSTTNQIDLRIKNSTISNNTAANGDGGGIICITNNNSAGSSILIENSTICGNVSSTSAKNGGGIYVSIPVASKPSTLTINHCTIANNTTNAGTGGDGVCVNTASLSSTTLVMNNSIVMNNSGSTSNASDVHGLITNSGITNSIFTVASGNTWFPGAGTNTHNKLDATVPSLAFAGSLSADATPVLKIGAGSIARDYVSAPNSASLLTTDQLGCVRVGNPDAGAYEFGGYYAISGTTNAATIPCTTCDVNVASGAELTVGADKTLNSLTVAAGGKLTRSAGTLTATNGITLESDATGTATLMDNYSTPTISATVKQYVTAGRNWYISPSISSAPYTALNRGTSVVEWNEGIKDWVTINSGTLTPGRGYIQVATSTPSVTGTTGTVNFTGTTNSGDITTPTLTRTGTDATSGFNLVGNPYPSYLRWSGTNSVLTDANNSAIGTSFWYRTKNNDNAYIFVTHNGTSGYTIPADQTPNTTITGIIPPMQAFWVRVTGTTTMKFTNAMRLHSDNVDNKFKAPKADARQRLRLQLANGAATDEAMIYFDAAAANGFDNYDSPKMINNSDVTPDLYTKAGNEKLVINGLAGIADNMTMPLGFTLNAATTGLKFKVTELSNFATGSKVYLVDSENNSQTELLPETEYSFDITTATSNNESRFSLLFRAPGSITGVENTTKLNAQVYVNAMNQITIIAPANAAYSICNTVGQLIENGQTTAKLQTINCKLNTGVYFVSLSINGQREIQKVIIR